MTVSLELAPGGVDPIDPVAARMLPERACRHFQIVPVSFHDGSLTVASADPGDPLARAVASALVPGPVQFESVPPAHVERAIDRVFEGSGGHPTPPRIGSILLERGLIEQEDLLGALATQQRSGGLVGEILLNAGHLAEAELAVALAEQLRVPLVELDGFAPNPAALDLIPSELQRQGRCIALDVDAEVLYLALADPLDEAAYNAVSELTDLRIRTYMVSRGELRELGRRLRLVEDGAAAGADLLTRSPDSSASRVLSGRQRVLLVALVLLSVAAGILAPLIAGVALLGACVAIYVLSSLHRLALHRRSSGRGRELGFSSAEVAALEERDLPRYTLLVPLLGEAPAVPRLITALQELDYPRTKLEILLICEADDEATIEAVRTAGPPPYFELLVAPKGEPQTKPRACNYGLLQATGELVTVLGARDHPDREQLKKAVLARRRSGGEVSCVQCELSHPDAEGSPLTRHFATDHELWFDLVLPGRGATAPPVPLAGACNHFDRRTVLEFGGWDPFNVTADADLRLRLHRAGQVSVGIDSTTLEASSGPGGWIRRRSRWVEGHLQTYLVQMRDPRRLLSEIGVRGWWSFQLIIGGTAILILNPILWALAALWLLAETGLVGDVLPALLHYVAAALLLLGNLTFAHLAVAGAIDRRLLRLIATALLSPIQFGLLSIAAWLGLLRLVTRTG